MNTEDAQQSADTILQQSGIHDARIEVTTIERLGMMPVQMQVNHPRITFSISGTTPDECVTKLRVHLRQSGL